MQIAFLSEPRRYEVSTEKDSWLSDYLSKLSIKQFDEFFEFADYVLNSLAGQRTQTIFSANRIARSFAYSFVPSDGNIVDCWFWIDKFKLFFFLEHDDMKRQAIDRLWRKEHRKQAKETGIETDEFWYRGYYSECERMIERWTKEKRYREMLLARRRAGIL